MMKTDGERPLSARNKLNKESAAASSPPQLPDDPQRWLMEHGDALFGYALARVRNRSVAEDLVQETFVSALRNRGDFRGESEVRTWLIGILRHKIMDLFRELAKRRPAESTAEGNSVDYQRYFSSRGKLQNVSSWQGDRLAVAEQFATPQEMDAVERQEFRSVLDRCLARLGGMLSQAFVLRMMDELPLEQVCAELEISPTNLAVRLHRARLGLRACLERHWFGGLHK